jgi:hypothetical protein
MLCKKFDRLAIYFARLFGIIESERSGFDSSALPLNLPLTLNLISWIKWLNGIPVIPGKPPDRCEVKDTDIDSFVGFLKRQKPVFPIYRP